jgi:hypothetical protein
MLQGTLLVRCLELSIVCSGFHLKAVRRLDERPGLAKAYPQHVVELRLLDHDGLFTEMVGNRVRVKERGK